MLASSSSQGLGVQGGSWVVGACMCVPCLGGRQPASFCMLLPTNELPPSVCPCLWVLDMPLPGSQCVLVPIGMIHQHAFGHAPPGNMYLP
jgi:hypothetical protein